MLMTELILKSSARRRTLPAGRSLGSADVTADERGWTLMKFERKANDGQRRPAAFSAASVHARTECAPLFAQMPSRWHQRLKTRKLLKLAQTASA